MKLTERFDPFRADADPLSAYLADFRIEVDYFTHWPQQDFKTLKNLVSTRIKLVLQTQGQGGAYRSERAFHCSRPAA